MNLSCDFHDGKTSSELTQAVSGGRSVTSLLETIIFNVLPMFVDLAIAFTYFWVMFGPYMGLIMAATVVTYLYVTTKLHSQKASKRREYISIYRKEWTVGQQSLDGWMNASLFNMIPYERQRYASAVSDHMKSKKSYEFASQVITAGQALVMALGLLGAMLLGVYQVAYEGKSLGQFTTLLVYWAQLQAPLVFFSTMYREISYSLMDAERLLELFQTKPTITDLPNAKTLNLSKGLVKFDRVSFAYDERKPTLKNVSFVVPAGKTIALVGETGGGKSTILKLIDRFYDVKSGCISIDNQDIRDVTLTR
jgi:ABC-type transport system involved in Fe-S cluster assembly fused permease/ATPase subunit